VLKKANDNGLKIKCNEASIWIVKGQSHEDKFYGQYDYDIGLRRSNRNTNKIEPHRLMGALGHKRTSERRSEWPLYSTRRFHSHSTQCASRSFPRCGLAVANDVALIGLPDSVFKVVVMARPKPVQFFARLHVVVHATVVIVQLIAERAAALDASRAKSAASVLESTVFPSVVMDAVSASKEMIAWALPI